MGDLRIDWVHEGPDRADALRFRLEGTYHHTHRQKIEEIVNPVLEDQRPPFVVFDLLHYEYMGGDALFGLFLSGYDRDLKKERPTCFMARGQTLSFLQSLGLASGLESLFDLSYVETNEDVAQWLQERLAE